jgi:hypothetical protein
MSALCESCREQVQQKTRYRRPAYSITSSATARSCGGNIRPVGRLTAPPEQTALRFYQRHFRNDAAPRRTVVAARRLTPGRRTPRCFGALPLVGQGFFFILSGESTKL